jgi:hypothetical protein
MHGALGTEAQGIDVLLRAGHGYGQGACGALMLLEPGIACEYAWTDAETDVLPDGPRHSKHTTSSISGNRRDVILRFRSNYDA